LNPKRNEITFEVKGDENMKQRKIKICIERELKATSRKRKLEEIESCTRNATRMEI